MKKKILIVGGCGFIGHNLALKLKNNNYDVTVSDSLSVNNLKSPKDPNVVNQKMYKAILKERLDLLNKNSIKILFKDAKNFIHMQKIFDEIKPDIIIHLAAVSHANKSNIDPHYTYENSIVTLESSLEGARKNKSHLIFLSSSMVYGDFPPSGVTESSPCNPIGIYGNLKYSAEIMIKSYNQVFDMPFTIIRPSALYGERCVSRRVGQILIENVIQDNEIVINGDGNDQLDFTYINDLVDGIERCCSNKNAINQIFNITYGNSRKINDLIELLKKKFPNIKTKYIENEKFMPKRGTLINQKAKDLLDFKPKFAIENGYTTYINWYKIFWKKFING